MTEHADKTHKKSALKTQVPETQTSEYPSLEYDNLWSVLHQSNSQNGTPIDPKSLTSKTVLQLQRLIGNQAVSRLVSNQSSKNPNPIQRKGTTLAQETNDVDDISQEQNAEFTTKQFAQPPDSPDDNENKPTKLQGMILVQRKEDETFELLTRPQTDVSIGESAQTIQRESDGFVDPEKVKQLYKVTKEKGGQLFQFAKKIKDIADIIKEDSSEDKNRLKEAESLLKMAEAVSDASSQFYLIAENVKDRPYSDGYLKPINELIEVAKKFNTLQEAASTEKMDAFRDDLSDFKKAKAWAADVGETFNAAAELIPFDYLPIPSFIKETFQGLLRTPARYIDVVVAHIDHRTDQIDKYSGDTGKKGVSGKGWEGPLTFIAIYGGSFNGLLQFMQDEDKEHGLQKMPYNIGVTTLKMLIETKAPRDKRNSWLGSIKWGPDGHEIN